MAETVTGTEEELASLRKDYVTAVECIAEMEDEIARLTAAHTQAFAQGAEAMRRQAAGMFAEEARLLRAHGLDISARENDDIAEAILAMPLPPPAGKSGGE